jgi:filamentous hemagglutinin family protein
MKQVACQLGTVGYVLLYCLVTNKPTQAQISRDNTLPTPTNVSPSGTIFEITGGSQIGGNLFHSFQDFSVPTNNTAFFNNAANVTNIIGRVTGGNISNIDGLIRANGSANLLLINPSGISFGPNAQLNIGGSFLGSTASSLKFADGTEFSATNPQAPTLTVSVPLGLQFGQNAAGISVQGRGHNLTVADPIFSPVTRGSSTGLKVQPGQTLALVGGDISLEGGNLTAEGGRIELGSVAEGFVSLNATPQGWTFGYQGVPAFKDIELRSRAIADASGLSGGSIQVQGQRLLVRDGSLLLIQNQGSQPAGNIFVNAVDAVEVSGTNADGTVRSSLTNETVGTGRGGDVAISTKRLAVQSGATIVAKTVRPGTGKGGNVNVNASESVQVIGASAVNPSVTSSIVAATFGAGDGGNNTVSTGRLSASAGGTIATATFGSGQGGDLNVNATDSIEVIGVEPNLFAPSGLLDSAFSTGNTGNLTINTPRLTVRDGGRVGTSTSASGSAGNVTINAPGFVEVKGTVPGSVNPSLITSAANVVDPSLQQIFGLPPIPSGASGNVTINTGQLRVADGALITTRNDGSGSSGNMRIAADSVFLDNGGGITSELGGTIRQGQPLFFSPITLAGGKGGDIRISTQQLAIRNGASISTATFTNATGGDITVDASDSVQVVGFAPFNPNALSFITSSTFGSGNSGNITLSTGRLTILDGGLVGAATFGTGSGGDITVNATQSVEVIGAEPSQLVASIIGVSTLNGGNAGNLTVNAPRLVVRNGGRIDSSTAATGAAGSITINAAKSVEVSGTVPGTTIPSLVSSGANIETEIARRAFGLPPVPSGAAGNVTINTGSLRVTDGAQVNVRNEGLGNAGTLRVNAADSIVLDRAGGIAAVTASGQGGDITLKTRDLRLRRGSAIAATAGSSGSGGNITIDTNTLVALENSNISANAFQGMGGNIRIDTQALFLCQDCEITASSALGVDGVVEFTTSTTETGLGFLDLPETVISPEQIVAQSCTATQGRTSSEFTITGRGGLPPRPSEPLSSDALVSFDTPVPQTENQSGRAMTQSKQETELPPPARGWYVNSKGAVVLAAQVPNASWQDVGLRSPECHAQ